MKDKKFRKRVATGVLAVIMVFSSFSSPMITALATPNTKTNVESTVSDATEDSSVLDDTTSSGNTDDAENSSSDTSTPPVESGTDSESNGGSSDGSSAIPPDSTPSVDSSTSDSESTPNTDSENEGDTPEDSEVPDEIKKSEELIAIEKLIAELPAETEISEYDFEQCNELKTKIAEIRLEIANLSEEEIKLLDATSLDILEKAIEAKIAEILPVFEMLKVVEESSDITDANVGDEIALFIKLNRDDVKVNYQWQRMVSKSYDGKKIAQVYEYPEEAPTWYSFLISDKTEEQLLEENPNAAWEGIELYLAAKQAVDAIGETTDISFVWKTPNFALEGYSISALKNTDGSITLYADTTDTHYIANKNADGVYEFQLSEGAEIISSDWMNIDGATTAEYIHTVSDIDRNTTFRCLITIDDEEYMTEAKGAVEAQGVDTTELNSDTQIIYSAVKSIKLPELEKEEDLGRVVRSKFFSRSNVTIDADAQWIHGLNSSYEYVTADTYANVQEWLSNGEISQEQADRYWTKVGTGFGNKFEANTLNSEGKPNGVRTYRGFALSDGKLEVNSEWYGKTVYFRVQGSTGIGQSIVVPAASVSAGNRYKKAVTILNAYVPDAGTPYLGALHSIDSNFNYADGTHIMYYGINCDTFNQDPAQFMVDAEGHYRVDSFAWGVCSYDEPDISGKSYWLLKDYIGNGFGMMIGHDTMYGYAGSYWDAYGVKFNESMIDPNDTSSHYYNIGSWTVNDGHWRMNQLMGNNNGNTYSGTLTPNNAPSMILSSGGANGIYGKTTLFGDSRLKITSSPYDANSALLNPKYRTPTNYPYSFSKNDTFDAALTHTNSQVAFGQMWVQYEGCSYEFTSIGSGILINPTVDGKKGTNNFYLTGSGNFLMNQIGHLPQNRFVDLEAKLLINSMMFISQRKQCEICQSGQSSQEISHFVHRINSTNVDAALRALQSGGNYWYPIDDCYMLTEDIALPEGWTPIKNFMGHFNADVYTVKLAKNQAPLFEHTDSPAGKYTTGSANGWNLGNDSTKGVQTIMKQGSTTVRTTGVARVLGFLTDLFSNPTGNYAGYTVEIRGDDNTEHLPKGAIYNCIVNNENKYVISNLPTIFDNAGGVLRAHVYDKSGKEVTQYGPIKVNVDKSFWDTNMTTPLYLAQFTALPVQNQSIFEGETAEMFFGGVYWESKVEKANIAWQYMINEASGWQDIKYFGGKYEISEPEFHAAGDDSYTTTNLTIFNSSEDWSGYRFRAVFSVNGRTADTYTVRTPSRSGLLTVQPIPMYVTDPLSQSIYIDSTAKFSSTCDAAFGSDDGLNVQWQVRRYSNDAWMNVENYPEINTSPTSISVTKSQSAGTISEYCPAKTSTTLEVKTSSIALNRLQFRVLYSYNSPVDGNLRKKATSDNAAKLTVMPPQISSEWIAGQETRKGVTFENPLVCNLQSGMTSDVAVYEADVYYLPGKDITTSGTPSTEVLWKYKTLTNPSQVLWNQSTANALAANLGVAAPKVTITNGTPVKQANGMYKIHTKMTVTNLSWKFYSDDCFLQFTAGATNKYQTFPYQNFATETSPMPLYIDFSVGIKWNEGTRREQNDYSLWTYPNMTVNSSAGVKTLLLYLDKALTPTFDKRDGFSFSGLPAGMRVAISNPTYVMLVSDYSVSDAVVEKFLRTQMSVKVYDTSVSPKLRAYINATDNLGVAGGRSTRSAMSNGSNVSFFSDEFGIIEGQTEFKNVYKDDLVSIPKVTPKEGYTLSHWEDNEGRHLSLYEQLKVSKNGQYTAVHVPENDFNNNGCPDEFEASVTYKIKNGQMRTQSGEYVNELTIGYPLRNSEGKYSAEGTLTLSNEEMPSVVPNEGYTLSEWAMSGDVLTKDGLNATYSCVPEKDINDNGIADEEEPHVTVMFVSNNEKGTLKGQTEFRVISGMTWDEIGITVPTPAPNEAKNNGEGKAVTEYFFENWSTEIPDGSTVVDGEDGDIIVYTANFNEREGKISPITTFKYIEQTPLFNEMTSKLRSAVDTAAYNNAIASPRATTIRWASGALNIGSSATISANAYTPYMQWQVADASGVWQDCIFETNQTLTIGRLYGNMSGWQYRLKYGSSPSSYSTSNTVTISYSFDVNVSGRSNASFSGSNSSREGNHVYVDAAYRSRVNWVRLSGAVKGNGPSSNGTPVDGNIFLNSGNPGSHIGRTYSDYDYTPLSKDIVVNTLQYFSAVVGVSSSAVGSYSADGYLNARIRGGSSGGGDNSGVAMQRSNHEAYDITTVFHKKTSTPPNVIAVTSANDKVYDGIEGMGSVVLTDRNNVLSASELNAIKARGSMRYSSGKTTTGSATSGSGCIDVSSYTVTFIPSSSDAVYFASNNGTDIDARTATFSITQRPISVYSYNNNKIYDRTSDIVVKNIRIKPYNSVEGSGLITSDVGKVNLNTTTFKGSFGDIKHQTNGQQVQITRPENQNLSLTGNKAINYKIVSEEYTGEISKRPVYIHSKYHDSETYSFTEGLNGNKIITDITRYTKDPADNYQSTVVEPNNLKQYDGKTIATIRNLAVDNIIQGDTVWVDKSEYKGSYSTKNAGETLTGKDANKDNGRIKKDRMNNLTETKITRNEAVNLANNDYGDYFIATEDYSGAIYRGIVSAYVKGNRYIYGDGMSEKPFTDSVYNWNTSSKSWLSVTGLVEGDKLAMADWTKKYKNEFVLDVNPDESTPVGSYHITYIGLNEDNFNVFSNYIVSVEGSSLSVTPRPILVNVKESEKSYGNENPSFFAEFKYQIKGEEWKTVGDDSLNSYEQMKLVAKDTIANTILIKNGGGTTIPISKDSTVSNIPYKSDCETNSDVRYLDEVSEKCEYCSARDGKDKQHFHLAGYGVWINENSSKGNTLAVKSVKNMYGETVQNYTLEYTPSTLKVHPLSAVIRPDDKNMVYGTTNEPALTYVLDGRRVKWDDLATIKLLREPGLDVHDKYEIRVDSYTNAENYMVETETGFFKITPNVLTLSPRFEKMAKVYGDDIPKWTMNVTGLKYLDSAADVLTGKEELDNKDFSRISPIGDYKFHIKEGSVTVKENKYGNYNYNLAFNMAAIKVTPRPIIIEAKGWVKEIGEVDPYQDFVITDVITGAKSSDKADPVVCVDPAKFPITFDLTRQEGEELGAYPVYSSEKEKENGHGVGCHCNIDTLNINYNIEYRPDNDIIVKQKDGIYGIVNSHTRYYGSEMKDYIGGGDDEIEYYKVDDNGVVKISEEEAGINSVPAFFHADKKTSSVGSYQVIAFGVTSSIYESVPIYSGYTTVIARPVTAIAQDNGKIFGEKEDPTLEYFLHDGHSTDGVNFFVGDKKTALTGDAVKVNAKDLQGDVRRKQGEDVGKYAIDEHTINPLDEKGNKNYDIKFVAADFEIKPATLVVTVMGGYSKSYGEDNPTFGANITGFRNGDTKETALNGNVAFSTLSTRTADAGRYIVSAKPETLLEDGELHRGSILEAKTNSNGKQNYEIVYLDGYITIGKLQMSITIDNQIKIYGSEDPYFSYSFKKPDGTSVSVVDPENSPLNLQITRTEGENVGKGDVTGGAYLITGTYSNPNYEATISDASLTIVPVDITVRVNGGYSKTYGEENPAFNVVYEGFVGSTINPDKTGTGISDNEGVISGDAVLECFDNDNKPVNNKTNVGKYVVKTNQEKSNLRADNYKFKYVDGTLTIGKKTLVVVVDDQQKVYGDGEPATYTWRVENKNDIVNDGDERYIQVKTDRPTAGTEFGEQVGKYPITGSADATDNYEITVKNGSMTITPAALLITVISDRKLFGEENPETKVVIDGYKRNDTIDEFGGLEALIITNEADRWSAVAGGSMSEGKYLVTAKDSTLYNKNYDVLYLDGTLDVLPLTVAVSVEDDMKIYGSFDPNSFKSSFTVNDNLGAAYNASKEQIEEAGKTLSLHTIREPGEVVDTYTIYPQYTENVNFIVTSVVKGEFEITPAKLTIVANSSVKVYDGTPLINKGYQVNGLINNEILGIKDTATAVSVNGSQIQVGKSPNTPSNAKIIHQNGAVANQNYEIQYLNGVLEVTAQEKVFISKSSDRKTATDGDEITYTISVTNATQKDLENVKVKDANNFIGNITVSESDLYSYKDGVFTIAKLPCTNNGNGENSITITYSYSVSPQDRGTDNDDVLVNSAKVVDIQLPDGTKAPEGWFVGTKDIEVDIIRHGLSIAKQANKGIVNVGEAVEYTITVKNTGNTIAKNILVVDENNFTGDIEIIKTLGVVYNGDGTWTIPKLGPNVPVNIKYSYTAQESDVANGKLNNIAIATLPSSEGIPEIEEPSNEVNVPVISKSVEIKKSADKKEAYVGDVVKYTINVANTGSIDLTNVTVKDLSNGIGIMMAGDGRGYTYADGVFSIEKLATGKSVNIEYLYLVVNNDPTLLTNIATVTVPKDESGLGEDKEIVKNSNQVNVTILKDGLNVEKSAEETSVKSGEEIHYTIRVSNNGTTKLTNVAIKDIYTGSGEISEVSGADYNAENHSWIIKEMMPNTVTVICYTYTATQEDAQIGNVNNTASAEGVNPKGEIVVGGEDSVDVEVKPDKKPPVEPAPEKHLSITKVADKQSVSVGDVINYTVTVKNDGQTDEQNILIKDIFNGKGSLDAVAGEGYIVNNDNSFTILKLKMGESIEIKYSYTVLAEDIGSLSNTVVVTPENPPLVPEKSSDTNIAKVDEIVTYTINVRNTTNVTIENVTVTDQNNFNGNIEASNGNGYKYNGDGTWTIERINAGETISIVYTYKVLSSDESSLINRADIKYSYDGKDYNIPSNAVDVETPDDGIISIIKSADKKQAAPGDVINYQVTLYNNKTTDVKNVVVEDNNNFVGNITVTGTDGYRYEGGKFIIDEIKAGSSITIKYSYIVLDGDIDIKLLENIATALIPIGGGGTEEIPSNKVIIEITADKEETPIIPLPPEEESASMTVKKTANKETVMVGDKIIYTITVENIGESKITNINLTDNFNGKGEYAVIATPRFTQTATGFNIPELDVAKKISIVYEYKVLAEDIGILKNTVITDTETELETPVPPIDVEIPVKHLSIEKTADKQIVRPDDIVNYTIKVINDGAKDLFDVLVKDEFSGKGTINVNEINGVEYQGEHCWKIAALPAGTEIAITYSYKVLAQDANTLSNAAFAVAPGTNPENDPDIQTPSENVDVPVVIRDLSIKKSVDKEEANVGDILRYSVNISNTGNVQLENIIVEDTLKNVAGVIVPIQGDKYRYENDKFVIPVIEVGESIVVQYTYTILEEDAGKTLLNIAVATIPETENPNTPEIEVPSEEIPTVVPDEIPVKNFVISKTSDKDTAKVGDTITYNINVKNTGSVELLNMTVRDINDGANKISVLQNEGYTYDETTKTFTVAQIGIGEEINITYTYLVVEGDKGKVIKNVAIAKVTGTNPENPDKPGEGINPDKPIDTDVEKPSNEVEVPVDSIKPTPTPTPNPEEPEQPERPAANGDNPQTGVGILENVLALISVLALGAVMVFRKKKD